MKVGLFIPCYVDQLYPHVAVATLSLLEKHGCSVHYPSGQTCCGQPMANSGFGHLTAATNELFIRNFSGYDYIVSPSGSCTLHIKEHLSGKNAGAAADIRSKVYEVSEFLVDVLKLKTLNARFPFKVAIHQSCHGQRGLHLSGMSELMVPNFSKPVHLLKMVKGIELVELKRSDECCGFGGTFCVTEQAVSAKMGKDRVDDLESSGAQYVTGADMSCLMHLGGIVSRRKSALRIKHIVEILNAE